MEERRRCTTVRQLELLIEFLEKHKDLALGRVRSKEARAMGARLWAECADILNVEGPARTSKEWTKVWNDFKCKVRAKLVSINASQRATGGGPSTPITLTALEERVANILGRDVGPLPNVTQDHFGTNDVTQDHFGTNDDNIVTEEIAEEVLPEQETAHSQILLNQSEAERIPLTTPIPSPIPSESGQARASSPIAGATRVRARRRAERALRQPLARVTSPRSTPARTSLEESRRMVLEIEKLRAQADLKLSEAISTISDSFRLIAQSIDRFTEKYCQQ